jgi:hypothetical protein
MSMDCEKFESVLIDELYGELDELTSAAVKRHVAGCARCASLLGGLRATRLVGSVPFVAVPVGLEERIMAAAADAQQVAPLKWRVARVVSLAGSWAMRPQTAMAAVFMVMIGTSVLLLRGRSSRAPASAEMTVTEEGTPAPAVASIAPSQVEPPGVAATAPPVAFASAAPADKERALAFAPPPPAQESSLDAVRSRAAKPSMAKADDEGTSGQSIASRGAGAVNGLGGGGSANAYAAADTPGAAPAAAPAFAQPPQMAEPAQPAGFDASGALAEARAARDNAVRQGLPCPSVARFNDVANRAAGTPPGWDALFEGALCYESLGDFSNARNRLNVLLRLDAYKDRARAQLDQLNQIQTGGAAAGARAAPKAAAPAGAAAPPARPAP